MDEPKLIATRGEEPTFLPGPAEETWRRVDFGLGASSIQSSPNVQAALPPRRFPWGRVLAFAVLGALGILLILKALSRLFR